MEEALEQLLDGGGSTKAEASSVSFPSPTFLPFYALVSQNGPEKKRFILDNVNI